MFKLSASSSSSTTTYATSLSFSDSGDYLLAACSDESLQIYDPLQGTTSKSLLSKKYGCHLARFTHHSQSIVYTSTKGSTAEDMGTIRYHSTHDNVYLRYFRGHAGRVSALEVCPGADTFASCGVDDHSVRLWDLRSPSFQGKLSLATPTLAAYDPSASVLAIASPSTASILLYDARHYDQKPFATFDLLAQAQASSHLVGERGLPRDWTRLEFSNDGKSLLLGTNGDKGHLLMDAFDGNIKAFLMRPQQFLPLKRDWQRAAPFPSPAPAGGGGRDGKAEMVAGQGDVCLSADGRYVIGATGGERDAVVWDTQGRVEDDEGKVMRPLASLPCKTRVGVVAWNPRYNMLATGDKEVVMWLPDEHVGMKPP